MPCHLGDARRFWSFQGEGVTEGKFGWVDVENREEQAIRKRQNSLGPLYRAGKQGSSDQVRVHLLGKAEDRLVSQAAAPDKLIESS